jgi:hypothetical protein
MRDDGRPVPGLGTRLLDAALIGLPDAVTSAWCLWVWIHPMAFGAETVKCVVMMMLMEFLLLNATGFFTAIPFMIDLNRGMRAVLLFVLCAVFFVMIGAFASQFHAIWPYFAFGWLAAGKLAWVVRNRRVTSNEQTWLTGSWAISLVAYLGSAGISVTQRLPTLGIVPAIVPSLQLSGPGDWFASPHKAVASAVFYFAAVAIFKWMYVAIRKNQPGRSRRGGEDAEESFDPVA